MPLPVGAHVEDGVRGDAAPGRSIASPPRKRPAPPVSGTRPYRSTTIGHSASATSTGTFAIDAQGFASPSLPSRSGRPPHVPTTSSLKTNGSSSTRPVNQASVEPPSPAAAIRSGTSCASAPLTTSETRYPATPRIDDAFGMTTWSTVPGCVTTVIGRSAPPVRGMSTDEAVITQW